MKKPTMDNSIPSFDFANHHLVFSHIRHNVRRYFKLNLTQYIVIDIIFNLSRNQFCTLSKDTIAFELGINRDTVYETLKMAIKRKLIYQQYKKGGYKTTKQWDTMILNDDIGKQLLKQQKDKSYVKSEFPKSTSEFPTSARRNFRHNTYKNTNNTKEGNKSSFSSDKNNELTQSQLGELTIIVRLHNKLSGKNARITSSLTEKYSEFIKSRPYDLFSWENALEKFNSETWRVSHGRNELFRLFDVSLFEHYSQMTDKELETLNQDEYKKSGTMPTVKKIHTSKVPTVKSVPKPERKKLTESEAKNSITFLFESHPNLAFKKAKEYSLENYYYELSKSHK